jgi:GNAT superfamily N-acetyltransferase
MTIALRHGTVEDADQIHRFIVALATYEREPDAVRCTVAELREQLAAQPPPFHCILADLDGAPVGFALYFHNYSTWRGRSGLYLEDLFVVPESRGQGVGKRLLAELARTAVDRGCGRMEWAVLDWNQPAIDFYRRLGARPMAGWTIFRLTDDGLAALASEAS